MLGLFLASIFALSLVGVGYAYWYEYLYVDGSVTMGTFWGEMSLYDYWDNDDGVEVYGRSKDVGEIYCSLEDYTEEADLLLYPKTLTISIEDGYPGYCAWVWWDMHWVGTVPAHVDVTYPQDVPDWVEIRVWVMYSDVQAISEGGYISLEEFIAMVEDSQWHACNWVDVEFEICIVEYDDVVPPIGPEPDSLYEFDICFDFYQYNLDPDPTGGS